MKVIKDFGETAINCKILIFTFSLDMNMPTMKRNPETIICVNSYITGIMFGMNDYLNYTKVVFT